MIPRLGVVIDESEQTIHFTNGKRKIHLTRVYSSPCTKIPEETLALILQTSECSGIPKTSIQNNINRLQSYCERNWTTKINHLKSFSHGRRKRSISAIITGLTAVATLVKESVSMYLNMKNNLALTDFQKSNSRMIKLLETKLDSYASLSQLITDDFSRLQHAICGSTFEISKSYAIGTALKITSDYLVSIESEILSLYANSFDFSLDFYQTLLNLCLDTTMTEMYCKFIIRNHLIEINYLSTYVNDKQSINLLLEIVLPNQANQFNSSKLLSISNNGYFHNNLYHKIKIPAYFIEFQNQFYPIQYNLCKNNLCHVNTIYLETSSLCLNSIYNNKTENCKSENYGRLSVCEFTSTFVGTVITASNATIFEQSEILKTKHIYSDTIITKNDGTLICNMGADQSKSYSYFSNEIAVTSNREIGVIEMLEVDFHSIQVQDTLQLSLKKNVSQLLESDDNVKIINSEIHILIIIFISFIIYSCLLCSIFFKEKLLKLFQSRETLCWNLSSLLKKSKIQVDEIEIDEKSKGIDSSDILLKVER